MLKQRGGRCERVARGRRPIKRRRVREVAGGRRKASEHALRRSPFLHHFPLRPRRCDPRSRDPAQARPHTLA